MTEVPFCHCLVLQQVFEAQVFEKQSPDDWPRKTGLAWPGLALRMGSLHGSSVGARCQRAGPDSGAPTAPTQMQTVNGNKHFQPPDAAAPLFGGRGFGLVSAAGRAEHT